MRAKVPTSLTRKLAIVQANEVNRWWQGVTPANRRTLRRDPGRPPPGVVGLFVEASEARDAADETTDFYEYLVNHELYLEDGRGFRICSAHPDARSILARGLVPASFACPLENAACPLRRLLDAANGCDVRFSLKVDAPRRERGARG